MMVALVIHGVIDPKVMHHDQELNWKLNSVFKVRRYTTLMKAASQLQHYQC